MKLSEKITELRKRNGWSQEQLAVKLDVSRQAVYKWEADMNQPDIDKLKRIAHLFGVSYNVLMDDDMDLPLFEQIAEAENGEIQNEHDTEAKEVLIQESHTGKPNKKKAKKVIIILSICAVAIALLCIVGYIAFGIDYQKETYTVKFYTYGETAIDDITVKEGKSITNVITPTKRGYTFECWYLDGEKFDIENEKITKNITLVAGWTANEHTLTYVDYETGNTKEIVFKTDEKVHIRTDIFEKQGYVFAGWAKVPNGGVVIKGGYSSVLEPEDLTLYAIWEEDIFYRPKYSIEYELNGGTNNTYNPWEYTVGYNVTLKEPSKEGYLFEGWYLDKEFTKKVETTNAIGDSGNVTLYAKWVTTKFDFAEVEDGFALVGYDGDSEIINIPNTYLNKSVVEISENAFCGNGYVCQIIIPETVKRIDKNAFDDCQRLTTIIVNSNNQDYSSNNGVLFNKDITYLYKYPCGKEDKIYEAPKTVNVIGAGAFLYATHIEEIKLPNDETLTYGVGRIGKSAFDGCTSLEKIELGCVVNYLEAGCFRNCTSLKEIEFKADTVWGIERAAFEGCTSLENVIFNYSTVKEIGEYVFMGCTSLSKFDLSSVEKIGACAFYGTGLKELYIPTTVKYVGAKLFMGCIYEELTVYCEASNTPNEWASDWLYGAYKVVWNSQGQDDNNQSQNISFTYKIDGGNAIITGCHNGKNTIKIPRIIDGYNVTSIGEGAFKDNTEIVEVIIPSSVLSVGKTAFEGCVGIKKFSSESIYSKITALDGVLYDDFGKTLIKYPLGKLSTEFSVPNDVEKIDENAFKNNIRLSKISLPGVTKIEKSAFYGCTALDLIDGKLIAEYIESEAFYGCTSLTSIEFLAENVYFMGDYAFYGCTRLKNAIFKGNVASIGAEAFRSCTNLYDVKFEKELGALGEQAFGGCGFEQIKLPEGIKLMPSKLFSGCQKLKKVNIPSTVTRIEDHVINYTAIQYINIPSSVAVIEDYAFAGVIDLFIFCEAEEKALGWCSKWNYNGNSISDVPLITYWNEQYSAPTFEFTIMEDGSSHITGVDIISNGVLILPHMNGTSRVTDIFLTEENALKVKEIFISQWINSTAYEIDLSTYGNLKNIIVSSQNYNLRSVDGVLYNREKSALLFYPASKEESEYVSIKELKTIKANAFKNAKYLTSIVLDNERDSYGVEIIEEAAFYGCAKLSEAHLGKTIREIGKEAFRGCTSIKYLEFINTKSLKIDTYAFYECTGLESVSFYGISTDVGDYAFALCENVSTLAVFGVNKIGSHAFNCNKIKQIFIPNSLSYIMSKAFDNYENTIFYCGSTKQPTGWRSDWINTNSATVIWGQKVEDLP